MMFMPQALIHLQSDSKKTEISSNPNTHSVPLSLWQV